MLHHLLHRLPPFPFGLIFLFDILTSCSLRTGWYAACIARIPVAYSASPSGSAFIARFRKQPVQGEDATRVRTE